MCFMIMTLRLSPDISTLCLIFGTQNVHLNSSPKFAMTTDCLVYSLCRFLTRYDAEKVLQRCAGRLLYPV
jgi:hypothetical protein